MTRIPPTHPRLFLCSNASGMVKIEEVFNFSQEDLDNGHIMILDAFHEIFIRVGELATHNEKRISYESLLEYVEKSQIHAKNTPVSVTYSFKEPPEFILHFRSWQQEKWPEKKRNLLPAKESVQPLLKEYYKTTYTYEELTQDVLPPGVDATKLEIYLSDAEFVKIFKMTREAFVGLQAWKAEKLKQDLKLF